MGLAGPAPGPAPRLQDGRACSCFPSSNCKPRQSSPRLQHPLPLPEPRPGEALREMWPGCRCRDYLQREGLQGLYSTAHFYFCFYPLVFQGFGFVTMGSTGEAFRAKQLLDGAIVEGRRIEVRRCYFCSFSSLPHPVPPGEPRHSQGDFQAPCGSAGLEGEHGAA